MPKGRVAGTMSATERSLRSERMHQQLTMAHAKRKPFGGFTGDEELKKAAQELSETLTLSEMVKELTNMGFRKKDGGIISRNHVWHLRTKSKPSSR